MAMASYFQNIHYCCRIVDCANINDVKYNSQEYDKDYAKIYNDRTIEFVQTTFKQDFDYFEYDINPFW